MNISQFLTDDAILSETGKRMFIIRNQFSIYTRFCYIILQVVILDDIIR